MRIANIFKLQIQFGGNICSTTKFYKVKTMVIKIADIYNCQQLIQIVMNHLTAGKVSQYYFISSKQVT